MRTCKLTFAEAIERISEQRSVHYSDVRADALRRVVWVAEWHIPGCLSESQAICLTKSDAIAEALQMASDEDGAPHGMRADLERHGRSDRVSPSAYVSMAVTTVSRCTLADLL